MPRSAAARPVLYYRHTLPVRIMHWINVVALTVLFMSGLQIFNAHPALNFGKSSYNGTPPVLEIGARMGANGQPQGVTRDLRQGIRHDRLAGRDARLEGRLRRARRFRRG